MKQMIFILSLFFLLLNCNNSDTEQQENAIIGTWELIEFYGSDGGSNPQWVKVKDSYTYTFDKNGSFTSNRFSECNEGNYSISGNKLALDYGCNDFDAGIETPAGTFVEEFVFEGTNMILTPTYLTCIEGCKFKFKKIETMAQTH